MGHPEPGQNVMPVTGGTTFFVVTFVPDIVVMSSRFDQEAAGEETMRRLPGLLRWKIQAYTARPRWTTTLNWQARSELNLTTIRKFIWEPEMSCSGIERAMHGGTRDSVMPSWSSF